MVKVKVTNFYPDEDSITVEIGSNCRVQAYRDETGETFVRVWQKGKGEETHQLGSEGCLTWGGTNG